MQRLLFVARKFAMVELVYIRLPCKVLDLCIAAAAAAAAAHVSLRRNDM
jgi:hypothetical protein